MIGPKYVETNSGLRRDREHELISHQKHLKAIVSRSRKLDISPLQIRRKSGPVGNFLQSARQYDILRENKALFERLLDISQGKWSAFPVLSPRSGGPKSLNAAVRSKEVQKILEENSTLGLRLVNKSGLISSKKMFQEYSEMRKYRKQIIKMPLSNAKKTGLKSQSSKDQDSTKSPGKVSVDRDSPAHLPNTDTQEDSV